MTHRDHSSWKHHDYSRSDRMKEQFIPLEKVIRAVDPEPDDVIVDAACGSGFYTLELAHRVSGVFAVDSNADAIEQLNARLRESGIENVNTVEGDICTYVPDSGNKVFISNAFHDLACGEEFIQHFAKGLNFPAFILIEFRKDASIGPPVEIRISESRLTEIFGLNGYALEYSDILEHHYIHRYVRKLV